MAAVLVLCLPQTATAQPLQASLSHYSTEDGLASNSVAYIAQDDYGYMWLATWNGLSRFDGYNFYNYRTGNGSHIENMHNRIMDFVIDGAQNIWLRMYDGRIFTVNRMTDKIVFPFEDVSGGDDFHTSIPMLTTTNGNVLIYIDNVGLFIMRLDRNGIRHQLVNADRYKITSMAEGYQGDIWLGTDKGVHRLDVSNLNIENNAVFPDEHITCLYSNGYNIYGGTDNGKVIYFAYGQEPKVLKSGGRRILYIMSDSHGLVWFCDEDDGASRIDPATGNVKRFTQTVPVRQYDGNGMFREAAGYVWVRMTHGGYGYYNRETDQMEYFHNDPSNSWNLNNSINAALELDEGVIWESTARKGLEKLELLKNTIERRLLVKNPQSTNDNEVRAMMFDKQAGLMYMGNKSGTMYVRSADGTTRTITHDSQGKPFGRLYGIAKARNELMISSKDNGLYVMGRDGHFTHYQNEPGNKWSMNSNAAYNAVQDKEGNIWVATYGGGVNVVTRKKDKGGQQTVQVLHPDNAMRGYPLNGFRKARAIALDKQGNTWVGTTDGLLVMSLSDGKLSLQRVENSVRFPDKILMSNDVVCMALDPHGTLWIGTNGGGLSRVIGKDRDGRYLFENFGAADGLPSEEIRGITFDEQDKVWFTTDALICSFEPTRRIFTTYTTLDGVDNTQISEGAAVALPNGDILIGTLEGYYFVNRRKLVSNNGNALKLRITDFFLDEELQTPRLNDHYDFYVPDARSVTLPSHNSQISLRFASLNYQLQHRVHYMYMLEGYEHQWLNADKSRTVTYRNLPSGSYRFRVKAFLLESPEKYDMRTLEVVVPPPFLLSGAAVWLYILLGILLTLWLMFRRQNSLWRHYHPGEKASFMGIAKPQGKSRKEEQNQQQKEPEHYEEPLDDEGVEFISDDDVIDNSRI